jgi:hypothetical protein
MAKKTERFELRFDLESLASIDEWRRLQPDLPSRAEAIRRLVDSALRRSSARAQQGREKRK